MNRRNFFRSMWAALGAVILAKNVPSENKWQYGELHVREFVAEEIHTGNGTVTFGNLSDITVPVKEYTWEIQNGEIFERHTTTDICSIPSEGRLISVSSEGETSYVDRQWRISSEGVVEIDMTKATPDFEPYEAWL